MKNFKSFYLGSWVIVCILLVLYLIAFFLGTDHVRVLGARIALPNENTYQLYKVNDTIAIELSDSNEFIQIIGYEKTKGLYALAGKYQINGDSVYMVTADYQKGDYIYSTYPQGRTTIVNIKTGEVIGQLAKESDVITDASQLKEYQDRALTFEEQYRLTKDNVEQQFEKLNTFNENLFTIVLAFIFVIIVLILVGIPMGLKALRGKAV